MYRVYRNSAVPCIRKCVVACKGCIEKSAVDCTQHKVYWNSVLNLQDVLEYLFNMYSVFSNSVLTCKHDVNYFVDVWDVYLKITVNEH